MTCTLRSDRNMIADILQKMAINRPQVLQQAGRAVERSAPLVGNITNAGLLSR